MEGRGKAIRGVLNCVILGRMLVDYRHETPITVESRRQLAERSKSSSRLRRVLSELGHDPDDMAAEVRRQVEKSTSKDEEGMR